MSKRATINDIAERSGVSTATVSLVLNGKAGVSQETRSRVLDIAAELAYAGKSNSVTMPKPEPISVAMLVKADVIEVPQENPFYSKIIWGIEDACRKEDIALYFSAQPVDKNNHPSEIPPLLKSKDLGGFLLVGAFVDATITSALGDKCPPIVLVDGYSDTNNYDAVVSDNFQASYDAVEHLIKKGHRHIALVGSEDNAYPSLQQRRNGYLRALKEYGITDTYIADFNVNLEFGDEAIEELMRKYPEVTAIFAVNDKAAVKAIHAIQQVGLLVPQDISVIGYDDTYLAVNVSPKLTTMHVDSVAMGQAAVQLLKMRIEHPQAARMTLTIHTTLVERNSVASPRINPLLTFPQPKEENQP